MGGYSEFLVLFFALKLNYSRKGCVWDLDVHCGSGWK